MTSRERVLTALDHKAPDRVPLYFGGTSSFMTDNAYFLLKRYLGIEGDVTPYRFGHTGNIVDNRILLALDVDVVMLQMKIGLELKRLSDDTVLSDWGIPIKSIAGYGTRVDPPLTAFDPESGQDEIDTVLDRYPWPDPFDPRRVEGLEKQALQLRLETDKAIVARSPQSASFLEYGCWLRGDGQFYTDFYLYPEFVHRLLDKILEIQKQFYSAMFAVVGPYLDIIETSEDYGTQESLLISPEMLREFIFPRRRLLNIFIKSQVPQARILHHSCGAIKNIIPELIETGVEILNPVQPSARGMAPEVLKDLYGDTLSFCGGIDMFKTLQGNEKDITDEIQLRIQQMGAGGGYLLAPSNHVQEDVRPENVVRLFELAKKYQ